MRYREIKPNAPLDQLVQCIWILSDEDNQPDVLERVVPDGCIELVIHYGVPFQQDVDGVSATNVARAIVAGQCTRFLELQRCGKVGIIAARFHSATATSFLRGNMDELTDRIRVLEAVGRVPSSDLAERIRDAGSDTARVALLERWLLQASSDYAPRCAGVVEATRLIRASKGQVEIATVARRLTISTRTLERGFRRIVGLTPKGFARIIRFRQVHNALTRVRDWTWADVAVRCGYTDQAHLVHEFRRFSGLPPARFLRDGGEMAAHLISAPVNR